MTFFSRALSLAGLVVLAGGSAFAQELPDAPHPVTAIVAKADEATSMHALSMESRPAKPMKPAAAHKFFDKTTFALSGMETAALLADGITTQNRLGQTITQYQTVNGQVMPVQVRIKEVDPVGKLFVNNGWPGQIAGGALTLGADLGIRYWLHKTNHHRMERVVPFMFAASNAYAAWHNTRY